MLLDRTEIGAYGGTGLTAALTMFQTNEIFQIVEMILAIISFVVSIGYTIYKWYHKAKADGKITQEEVKELMDSVTKLTDKNDKEE